MRARADAVVDGLEPGATPVDRRLAARILLTIACLAAIPVVSARALTRIMVAVDPEAPSSIVGRLRGAVEALPTIAANRGPTVVAIGSSITQDGFDPDSFDAAMARAGHAVRSYNLGQQAPGDVELLLARRVRDAFLRSRARLALAVVELSMASLTSGQYQLMDTPEARLVDDARRALVIDADTVWTTAADDPRRAFQDAVNRWVFGGAPPAAVGGWLIERIRRVDGPAATCAGYLRASTAERQATLDRLVSAYCAERARVFSSEPGPWSIAARGGRPLGFPRTRASYSAMTRFWLADLHESMEASRARRTARDRARAARMARWDERAIRNKIETVNTLAEVSDRVVLLVYPQRPDPDVIAGELRSWPEVVERIGDATGAPVIDLSAAAHGGTSSFTDGVHLTALAAVAFSAALARRIAASHTT